MGLLLPNHRLTGVEPMFKKFAPLCALLVIALTTSGCYFNETVNTNEVAVKTDGGRIVDCVGPGVHTDLWIFAGLSKVPTSALTFSVADKEVATKDTQLVGIEITVQVKRQINCDNLKNLLTNWSGIATNDTRLQETVSAIVSQGIKIGTRSFTLEELLDDRDGLALQIKNALVPEASKFSVEVVAIAVKDVQIDPAYANVLKEKALLTAKIDAAKRQQDLIRQESLNRQLEQDQRATEFTKQLAAEQAKTNVEVEIGNREGRVIDARNKIYATNPAALELKRLELLKDVLGNRSVIYMIPQGASLNLILGELSGGIVPISPTVPTR
jgi:hypothetical protein